MVFFNWKKNIYINNSNIKWREKKEESYLKRKTIIWKNKRFNIITWNTA